jgi:lauroyl/myristoyl acyltransferase
MSRWPRRVLDDFGYVAYVIVYRIIRWRRKLSATNIANAFPEKSEEERQQILTESYRNLGRFLAESLWGWNASAEALASRVRIVNPSSSRASRQRQSVVLLAAHFCNWEWLPLTAASCSRCRSTPSTSRRRSGASTISCARAARASAAIRSRTRASCSR